MPFQAADDGPVEISQLQDMHQRPHGRKESIRLRQRDHCASTFFRT